MTFEERLWSTAIVLFALFIALGSAVARRPPTWLDTSSAGMRGLVTPAAVTLTDSGRGPFMLAFSIVSIMAFLYAKANFWIPIVVIASQTISQGVVETFKHLFHRLRPDYWIVGEERGYSYPSGHASTSIVFYGTWAVLVATGPAPKTVKIALAVLIVFWILGIGWSRLALGAHYATDVIGGTLFGLAWLCAIAALLVHLHIPLRA
ncbi:MAG: phosphatase PAP2 family protein [Vulcanimicrobiaceae bacterium]